MLFSYNYYCLLDFWGSTILSHSFPYETRPSPWIIYQFGLLLFFFYRDHKEKALDFKGTTNQIYLIPYSNSAKLDFLYIWMKLLLTAKTTKDVK